MQPVGAAFRETRVQPVQRRACPEAATDHPGVSLECTPLDVLRLVFLPQLLYCRCPTIKWSRCLLANVISNS